LRSARADWPVDSIARDTANAMALLRWMEREGDGTGTS